MKKKLWRNEYIIIGVVLVAVILLAANIGVYQESSVLSVDKILLLQRGVGEAGEELKGGYWRVLATSQMSEVQMLKLSEEFIEAHYDPSSVFPEDIDVTGEIDVTVYQSDDPFWEIPVKKVATIEVLPEMYAVYTSGYEDTSVKTEKVKVDLWRLDLANKKVHIRFTVVASKIKGENTGPLATDHYNALKLSEGKYQFDVTQSDLIGGTYVVNFYNPRATEETFKITLQWAFGNYDQYSWDENLLFITTPATQASPKDINVYNTFLASDLSSITNQLNWKSGNDWTYHNYFYGGGDVFQGTVAYYGAVPLGLREFSEKIVLDSYGRSKAQVHVPYINEDRHIAEGYVSESNSPKTYDVYEYAGWFTPKNGEEGFSGSLDDWWLWRYPKQAQVQSNVYTKPIGKSVVNYLASSVEAPVTGYTHSAFQRRDIDVWNQGAVCRVPNNLYVAMPKSARSWLFTLDVSTELVDSIVVVQSYIDVEIVDFDVSKRPDECIAPEDYAIVSAKLRNKSEFGGVVSIGITPPDELKLASTITGGEGSEYFDAGEEKTVELTVTNNGNLDEKTSGTFTFIVTNQEPRVTAEETFDLCFLPGLGIPDTTLTVTVKDANSLELLSGINLRAEYGTNSVSEGTTTDGMAILDLGKFQGQVKLSATDPDMEYQPKTEIIPDVHVGDNPYEIYLVKFGEEFPFQFDWWWILLVFLAVGVAALVLGSRKRKRKPRKKRRLKLPKIRGGRK